jgi:hypothetical protein
MVRLIALGVLAMGCSSPTELPSEKRTTSVPGDTCAEYRDGATLVDIDCSDDLQCLASIFVGKDGSGWAGICHPHDAATCDGGNRCADGWVCTDGFSGRGPARQECLKQCATHADCPGRFQVCSSRLCRMLACPFAGEVDADPDASCPSSLHCKEGICAPQ